MGEPGKRQRSATGRQLEPELELELEPEPELEPELELVQLVFRQQESVLALIRQAFQQRGLERLLPVSPPWVRRVFQGQPLAFQPGRQARKGRGSGFQPASVRNR